VIARLSSEIAAHVGRLACVADDDDDAASVATVTGEDSLGQLACPSY